MKEHNWWTHDEEEKNKGTGWNTTLKGWNSQSSPRRHIHSPTKSCVLCVVCVCVCVRARARVRVHPVQEVTGTQKRKMILPYLYSENRHMTAY